MKKILLFTATASLASTIIITSCGKSTDENQVGNYNCHCLITTSGGSTHEVDVPFNNVTRDYAANTCATTQDTYNTGGNTATCALQ